MASDKIMSASQVQQAVDRHGGGWIARENWVSQLSKSEMKMMLGNREIPDIDVSFRAPEFISKAKPEVFDWRNKGGVNWVSPMMNQGACGSCVAFAAVATLETQMNISSGIPDMNPKYSPQQLFACGGGSCSFGWFTSMAPMFLESDGVPDEGCLPYTSGATGVDVACKAACTDSASRAQKIARYTSPTGGTLDIEAVKAALKKGPLMTSLRVYEDFMTYWGGVYKYAAGKSLGGHAMSIVGFDEAQRAWIVRNSWGESWGEKGYVYMSWDDISGVGNSTWLFEVPPVNGYLYVQAPKHHEYVSGSYSLSGQSNLKGGGNITTKVLDSRGSEVASATCKSATACRATWDSTTVPDGTYQAVAVTSDGDGKMVSSQKQEFFVVNKAPQLSVSFIGKGVDLKKPLVGNVMFDITANSSSAPFQQMEFHVEKPDGTIVRQKTTNIVLDRMVMNWGTNYFPNGNYNIKMIGTINVGKQVYQASSQTYAIMVNNVKK